MSVTCNKSKVLFLIFLLFGLSTNAFSKTLGFYLPNIYSVQNVEKLLKSDPSLGKYDVMVFAKMKDFLRANKQSNFDIAILPGSFGNHAEGFKPILRFERKGASAERLKLLSIDKNWDQEKLAKGVVGTVDEIGKRQEFKKHTRDLLPKKAKRFKQIAKAADLYPMLALENVDYILISSRDLSIVKKEIKSDPIEVMESNEILLPAIYLKEGAQVDKTELSKIGKKTLSELGFDRVVSI